MSCTEKESFCGKCCRETEMELSCDDVQRFMKAGYRQKDFMVVRGGVPRLRNVDG